MHMSDYAVVESPIVYTPRPLPDKNKGEEYIKITIKVNFIVNTRIGIRALAS